MLCVLGLIVLCGFFISTQLKPDPRGFGTHQQLGLPPCSFKMIFGIPCPSCGGTTSFACFVRGQWLAAVRANAAAFSGALVCAWFVPWSLFSSFQGRLIRVQHPVQTLLWLLLSLSLIALLQWGVRLLLLFS